MRTLSTSSTGMMPSCPNFFITVRATPYASSMPVPTTRSTMMNFFARSISSNSSFPMKRKP